MNKIEIFRTMLNSFLNPDTQVVRGAELAKTPTYPYVEMFILNLSPDYHLDDDITQKNGGVLEVQNLRRYTSTLQLNCRNINSLSALQLADRIYKLINFEQRDEFINKGIGIKNMSMIRNLNFFEAGKWAYNYSFDVEISFDEVETRETTTIENIAIKVKNEEVIINE